MKSAHSFLTVHIEFLPAFAGKLFAVQGSVGVIGSFRMPDNAREGDQSLCLMVRPECPELFAANLFAQNFPNECKLTVHCGKGYLEGNGHIFPAEAWDVSPFIPRFPFAGYGQLGNTFMDHCPDHFEVPIRHS